MIVAGVIVNNPSKSVDREFDYIVPTELIPIIKPGMRVIVPFGQGNKTLEGYIVYIRELGMDSNIKYKHIIELCDVQISLDEQLIEVAYFLKETYHCTLIDGIRMMLPSGTTLVENIQIKLTESAIQIKTNIHYIPF